MFLPDFSCGVELHGKQHYEFSPYFHETAEEWANQKRRDKRKAEICEREEIVLVVFAYNEPVEDVRYVKRKIVDAILI